MWKHIRFDASNAHLTCHAPETFNEFDILLHSEWDRADRQGLFTFPIDHHAQRRILDDGDLRYALEFNPGRYATRRTPYPFTSVNTPFDRNKFNFNKIKDAEVIFSLDTDDSIDKCLVIINNSPIRPYHVLLVPDRQLELPQILTFDCILFGLRFLASSAHPFLFVGFNSLCGYASINHLHLHGMYTPGRVFLQTIKCSVFHPETKCYLLDQFETQAFAFEVLHLEESASVARRVHMITNYFTSRNIALNVAFVKGDSFSSPNTNALRSFVWFRQSIIAGKMFDRCNFACLELSGLMPVQHENVFNELTEKEVRAHLNAIALPADEQVRIKADVKNLLDQ